MQNYEVELNATQTVLLSLNQSAVLLIPEEIKKILSTKQQPGHEP